ncbi:hypothetical protein ACTD5D_41270 [Nocardia takedensis]|uniref:hypothetical protein n=1 Tax=Nocardia takedensis TaxID=259390 RepID=UPI003F75B3F2
MSAPNLRTWAGNFARLRQILNSTATAPTAGYSRWHGADRILAPQNQAMIPMMMPLLAAGLMAGGTQAIEALPEQMRIEGREDLLLFGRYMLEITALKRENASADRVRTVLDALLERLEQTARTWTNDGIDREQREQLVQETRDAGRRLRGEDPTAA